MQESKDWLFTYFQTDTPLTWNPNEVEYVTWQLEKAPSTEKLHFQGFVVFKKKKKLGKPPQPKKGNKKGEMTQPSGVHKFLPGAHWEMIRGTRQQARDYCRKEETRVEGPWEVGTFEAISQGRREDLTAVKRKIDEGATMETIADQHFNLFLQYERPLRSYKKMKTPSRNTKTFTELRIGVPGSGKSYVAKTLTNNDKKLGYWKSPDKWWDGYEGQDIVILDDFKGGIMATQLQHLMDENAMDVETKGGKMEFNSKRLIITSNYLPAQWYEKDERRPVTSFLRRIDEIYLHTYNGVYKAPGDHWTDRAEWLDNIWSGRGDINMNEGDPKKPWYRPPPLPPAPILEELDPLDVEKYNTYFF